MEQQKNHFHSFPLSQIYHTLDQAHINKIYVKRSKASLPVSVLAFMQLNPHPSRFGPNTEKKQKAKNGVLYIE